MSRLTIEQQRDLVLDQCDVLASSSKVADDAWLEAWLILSAWRGCTEDHVVDNDQIDDPILHETPDE